MTMLNVTRCDNELYVVAYADGYGSLEVLHISSGYNDPVNYSVNLGSVLKPGAYNISLIGINWGGPAAFTVTLNGTPYNYVNPNAPLGLVWNPPPVTVTVKR